MYFQISISFVFMFLKVEWYIYLQWKGLPNVYISHFMAIQLWLLLWTWWRMCRGTNWSATSGFLLFWINLRYVYICSLWTVRCGAGVPSVLSVQPDENFASDNKNYGGLPIPLIFLAFTTCVYLYTYNLFSNDSREKVSLSDFYPLI